jgi:glycogen synthase
MEKNGLHILMTSDTVGGVWRYSTQLIESLASNDVRFTLVTMGAPASLEQKKEILKLKNVTLLDSKYKLEWMDDPWEDIDRSGQWILELEKILKPDIIHLNSYSHGVLEFKAPVVIVGHSCVYSWWNAVKKEAPPKKYLEYYIRVKKGLANVEYVVAPSYSMMDSLNSHYGSFKKQIVIPNGLNPSSFMRSKKSNYILSMGRIWDEAKNVGILEKISDNLDWPVFIAGDNHNPDNGKVKEINKISFLGKLSQEKVYQQLSTASIFVMPARYEPFGLSILEAALSGCVLILGDIPSLRENWNGAATFVQSDDAGELTEVINYFIRHNSQREMLASVAYERALNFKADTKAMRYLNLYKSILSEREVRLVEEKKAQNEHKTVLS